MKKIDPLYLVALSFVCLVASYFAFDQSKQKLLTINEQLNTTASIAQNFSTMKSDWSNGKDKIKKIDKIVSTLNIKVTDKTVTNKKLKLQITNLSSDKLDRLINKILNEKLNILKLNITKNSVVLEVGI